MTRSNPVDWPHPGSRWWKFDFHTHTPESTDTPWAQHKLALTPEDWLRKYMEAEIDCVAVTDHNSGAWIDKLKDAYAGMQQQAAEGFRPLTLFPGVEISVSGGIHLLAILDPSASSSDIDTLLGRVDYRATKGDSDGVTRKSPADVIHAVLEARGIPIPAHADKGKGLLRVEPETRKSAVDANTLRDAMDIDGLLAAEWVDKEPPMPARVEKEARRLTSVLGSDCHTFQGEKAPGKHFTWIKMAAPTIEGLRLALLDGNDISVHRSDAGPFDPFKTPKHFITSVEIDSARCMGLGDPQRLYLTPYYNALIGGRGSGKSTVVHALRLAYRRSDELGETTDPRRRFDSFAKVAKGRDGDGALRNDTDIRVELSRDGTAHRLRWRQDGQGAVIEVQDEKGHWQLSTSQALTSERFPIRLLSQGQIAAMADEGREALLHVMDEAAGVNDLHRSLDDAMRTWVTQRARLRELDGKLAHRPEVERKLAEVGQKLKVLAETHHADVLKAHQRAVRQRREVATSLEQLAAMPERIEELLEGLLLDDWPDGVFDPESDKDLLAWRANAEGMLAEAQDVLRESAATLADKTCALDADPRFAAWRQRTEQAQEAYSALQEELARQGVSSPRAFGLLLRARESLEDALKALDDMAQEHDGLGEKNQQQWDSVVDTRKRITQVRQTFVERALTDNPFVRMEVVGFGFEPRTVERSLRKLLECEDERFEKDILHYRDQEPNSGLAFDLANAEGNDKDRLLADIKQRLIDTDESFGGHFRNYLKPKLKQSGFADHILGWFPEDDLRIQYSRTGDGRNWDTITQGSQGQRSAALLAFLLAFGEEPLVLDQPEDDLDNHLIYDLIVRQIRKNKLRRQLLIVTHNPNVLVNGDAEMVHVLDFRGGQCRVVQNGALQQQSLREEVCRVMEGGREAFSRRWARLGREV